MLMLTCSCTSSGSLGLFDLLQHLIIQFRVPDRFCERTSAGKQRRSILFQKLIDVRARSHIRIPPRAQSLPESAVLLLSVPHTALADQSHAVSVFAQTQVRIVMAEQQTIFRYHSALVLVTRSSDQNTDVMTRTVEHQPPLFPCTRSAALMLAIALLCRSFPRILNCR